MRLLHVRDFSFKDFQKDLEPYAILSHRWTNSETTFADIKNGRVGLTSTSNKLADFAQYVKCQFSEVEWIWVDSCCINQDSSAELSEGVNRMFHWYRDATVCIAYLHDVEQPSNEVAFRKSVWFRRGWTLQELLASTVVIFLTRDWQVFGHKGNAAHLRCKTEVGRNIESLLAATTRIPLAILQDFSASHSLSIEERLGWMEGRETSREEDMFYAMFGIFDVAPNAHYGEGSHRARRRLLKAIEEEHASPGRTPHGEEHDTAEVEAWLSPPDASTNHASARERHEPDTCTWLIQHVQYKRWKAGATQHLWLHGKAGCGKSVLCSAVIEDLRVYCLDHPKARLAYFYFTFSDDHKQSYHDLLSGIVAQMGRIEPARSLLRQLYRRSKRTKPAPQELRKLLIDTMSTLDEVLIVMDALDESPELGDTRRDLFKQLRKLFTESAKLRLFATSRYLPDIRGFLDDLSCEQISIQSCDVSCDIQLYVTSQLSTEPRLRAFAPTVKSMIETNVSANADGMFRWAFLLLDQLSRLKKSNQTTIDAALKRFPKDLDSVYARILQDLEEIDQADVLTLLRWITYARRPLSLGELIDTLIIESEEHKVHIDDRCQPEDILRLLTSLVITIPRSDTDEERDTEEAVNEFTRIRLAHFTVQEYFESNRILDSAAKRFHLVSCREHHLITQRCLTYIDHFDASEKTQVRDHMDALPLLEYAASSWSYHSILHGCGDVDLELRLLTSESVFRKWLTIHDPDKRVIGRSHAITGGPLYYASFLGLTRVVHILLTAGFRVDSDGGGYGTALRAASHAGHLHVVDLLLAEGANVNSHGPDGGNVLQAAADAGHKEVVRLLLAHGANVVVDCNNMTPLHFTAVTGHEEVAEVLLKNGIPIDLKLSRKNWRSAVERERLAAEKNVSVSEASVSGLTPLHFAVLIGSVKMTRFFLDHGADANATSATGETPLHLLIKRDMQDPHLQDYWNISEFRIEEALDHVAIDDEDEWYMEVAAIAHWRLEIMQMLFAHGANVTAKDCNGSSPLHCVHYGAYHSAVILQELLHSGANATQSDASGRTSIHLACAAGDVEAAKLLLQSGSDVEHTDSTGMNALHYAARHGNEDIINLILTTALTSDLDNYAYRKDIHGQNALHHLLGTPGYFEQEAVVSLLSAGVGINDRDKDGFAPLALLLKRFLMRSINKAEIAGVLFMNGADPWPEGQNLAHLAARGDELGPELLRCLLEHGVDLSVKDHDARNVMHHLALHGSLEDPEAYDFLRNILGSSIQDQDAFGRTPLMIAASRAQEVHPENIFRSSRWQVTGRLLAIRKAPAGTDTARTAEIAEPPSRKSGH